jgi:hypothetical protein
VTLTGNVTFAAPTNMAAGNSLTLILTQDGTGGRTGTWNASYKWLGGTPTLSTTGAAIDVVNIFYDGTNYITGISKQDTSSSVTGLTITAAGEIRLADSDSSNYVGFKSPATVTTNNIWTLPATDGTDGQVLSTNGSDVLSWITPGGGSLNEFVITLNASTGSLVSGTLWRYGLTETYDSNNILSISSGAFTLAAGNYIVSLMSASGFNSNSSVELILRNETSSTNTFTFSSQALDASGQRCVIFPKSQFVNVASSTSFAIRGNYGSSNDQFLFDNVTFLFRKVS